MASSIQVPKTVVRICELLGVSLKEESIEGILSGNIVKIVEQQHLKEIRVLIKQLPYLAFEEGVSISHAVVSIPSL